MTTVQVLKRPVSVAFGEAPATRVSPNDALTNERDRSHARVDFIRKLRLEITETATAAVGR